MFLRKDFLTFFMAVRFPEILELSEITELRKIIERVA